MKLRRCLLAATLLLALWPLAAFATPGPLSPSPPNSPLAGQFLVASRRLAEPTFARSVIYIVAHNDSGAMGLMVNRVLGTATLQKLVSAFGVRSRDRSRVDVHLGGPVDPARGFVLHSGDYSGASTLKLLGSVSLSTGIDVMQAVAAGRGPKRRLFLFGYAGWAAGQLDAEMARGDWMLAPADESLIFSKDPETVWERALKRAGLPL